jgi:hypothetical protein
LDRGGVGVAFVGQRTDEGLSEPEVSKRGQTIVLSCGDAGRASLSLAAANRGGLS